MARRRGRPGSPPAASRSPGPAAPGRAANGASPSPEPAARTSPKPAARAKQPKLSKDAYRRQRSLVDGELTRLGLRRNHLELALADPAVGANFVELRRITSELADVTAGLEAAEEAWLELEDRAP